MRFSKIHLENWRNFTGVDADLADRVFVVGPNASGKSNLLDVLRFLRDIAVPGGGFRTAVAQRGGVSRLRCLAARRYPDIVIDVQIRNGDDASAAAWRYRLAFGQDNNRQPILKEEAVWHEGRQVLKRPDADDLTDPARLGQTHLEQVNANKDFRVVADFFGSVRYLHIVPQVVREPERSGGRRDDPHGGDFIERLAQVQERTRNARLKRIAEALHVAVPQLKELRQIRDERGVPHLEGLFEHWRPEAGWQREDQFSDGTLRLLGLLWSLMDGDGPLLLEEPELSLHTEVVRFLPQMFARVQRRRPRQILLSTHSSELLQDEGIGPEEVLMLIPSAEGTSIEAASGDQGVPTSLRRCVEAIRLRA